MVKWGEKLRDMVENAGIPKGEISKKLGITPGALSSTFGSASVRIDTIYKICEACGVKAWHFVAYVETGIPVKAWSNFERIMNLEEIDKNFVLEGINNSLRFIIEKNKKAVD